MTEKLTVINVVVPDPTDQHAEEAAPSQTVRCRACGYTLTLRRMAIEVDGAHEHTFRNPGGYSFHLMCFSDAAGSLREGEGTFEATWFPGYSWCFAVCGGCRTHVGWWYLANEREDGYFIGLIATRLAL